MTPKSRAFNASYGLAFTAFLTHRDEAHLRAAYELGRDAVTNDLGVLDLAVAHHDALAEALHAANDPRAVAVAAGDFFLEALSAYEMVQRGFREAREAAALERRQADLLRQLSNFLADASLALGESDSLEEMLQLVAEQARELLGAGRCRVSVVVGPERRLEAVSKSERTRWSGLLQRQINETADCAVHANDERRTLREPLTTLDGHGIGSIEVAAGDFTELDAALLVQLAQMAAAAVERRRLYRTS